MQLKVKPIVRATLGSVYLFGRSDFTVSFYGANVYPENVKTGIEDGRVRDSVPGALFLQKPFPMDTLLESVTQLLAAGVLGAA